MSPWTFRSPHPWPGVTDTVPAEFAACLHEPAFSMKETAFCIWRRTRDPAWQTGLIRLEPLTPRLVAALNPECALEELLPEQHEIGYPSP